MRHLAINALQQLYYHFSILMAKMFNVEIHNLVVNNGLMVTDVNENNNCYYPIRLEYMVYGIWSDFTAGVNANRNVSYLSTVIVQNFGRNSRATIKLVAYE